MPLSGGVAAARYSASKSSTYMTTGSGSAARERLRRPLGKERKRHRLFRLPFIAADILAAHRPDMFRAHLEDGKR